nr:YccF domain-containing protein [Prevotella sp. BV3P1]
MFGLYKKHEKHRGGIPWAKMHFRLMRLALAPFGKQIVNDDF